MPNNNIRSLVFIALFAALFIVFSLPQLKVTFSVIPFTPQTLAVILIGLFLKPREAFASIAVVILLAACGLPLFAGKGGLSHLIGYSGGFIFAFPFAAMLISWLTGKLLLNERLIANKAKLFIAFFIVFEVFSSLFVYIPGVPWMRHVLDYDWSKAFATGMYPFLPGDAAKALIGAGIGIAMLDTVIRLRSGGRAADPASEIAQSK